LEPRRQANLLHPTRQEVDGGQLRPKKGPAGAPRMLFQTRIIAPAYISWQYDVSPDGHFLINSFTSNSSSPLTLLTRWAAILK
jgi:hypothetical protein